MTPKATDKSQETLAADSDASVDDVQTETEAEPEPETETAPEVTKAVQAVTSDDEPGPRRLAWAREGMGGSRLLHLAVLIALAASIATAVLQWQQAGNLSGKNDTERLIRNRAGEFGQALLSYDHTNLKAARDRVMGLSTGDFSKFYDVDFAGALGPLITKLKATAKATVRDTYLNEVDGSRAKAIVVMDSEVNSTSGIRRVMGSYLDLEMVKVKGQWRVNAVSSVGTINESLSKPDGTPIDPKDKDAPKP